MKFSIIIPSFNASHLIGQAISSVMQQTHQDWEVIVMDNESTDETAATLNVITTTEKRVKFFCMKDRGIYDAMNNGIERAQGDYLYFMGADDRLYDETVLEKVNDNCMSGADIVYGNVLWKPKDDLEAGVWSLEQLISMNINHQRIFYKKILFSQYGNYDIRYKVASDYQLNIRFFCNNSIVKKHAEVIVANYHAEGFSANKTDVLFWEHWHDNIKKPFGSQLPRKAIYTSKGTYIRYLIINKHYRKAFSCTMNVFFNTFSIGFVILMTRFAIQKRRAHAA